MTDLAVVGGHLLDPGQGIDAIATIGISGTTVAGLTVDQGSGPMPGAVARGGGGLTLDATGLLVTPGLIDLHTHLYEGVSHYGIDPDTYCLSRGVSTAVDAGSSGAQTFPGLRRCGQAGRPISPRSNCDQGGGRFPMRPTGPKSSSACSSRALSSAAGMSVT